MSPGALLECSGDVASGLIMGGLGDSVYGFQGILSGLTKSTEHPLSPNT